MPAQAASASTTKSISRACRPGAKNCSISITPVMATAMSAIHARLSRIGEAKGEPDEDEGQRMLAVLAEKACGR